MSHFNTDVLNDIWSFFVRAYIFTHPNIGSSESIAHDSPNMFLSTDRHIRFELMKSGVQEALKRAQKHSKAEGAAEIAIKLVDFAKDKVGDLLDAYPPASLAWSGFCIITPVC